MGILGGIDEPPAFHGAQLDLFSNGIDVSEF
jgi:hypothetical protein